MADSRTLAGSSESGNAQNVAGCYEWAEALIMALVVVIILFLFLFRVNIGVSGDSMEPNYQTGDRVFISCIDRHPGPGDVVVIDAGATPLHERIIKRVIATEGQTVNIDFQTGVVSVDGKELDESAYIQNGITKDRHEIRFPQKVPKGYVFVLGDNRPVSDDSRSSDVGMIDRRGIIGKVKFFLKPFGLAK